LNFSPFLFSLLWANVENGKISRILISGVQAVSLQDPVPLLLNQKSRHTLKIGGRGKE